MSFSGAVKLADLNDYIAPALNCILPIPAATTAGKVSVGKLIEFEDMPVRDKSKFAQIKTNTVNKTAKITLNDCLACKYDDFSRIYAIYSGCITSAETILIQQQSLAEFLLHLPPSNTSFKQVVVTLSPQSVASIAVKYGISITSTFQKLSYFLKNLGVNVVLSSQVGLEIALCEAKAEFLNSYKSDQKSFLISGECPGWVCYAEKTQAGMLPYISRVKSPQAIMGMLIKFFYSQSLGIKPEDIYHVTVMPCFDKKLEASRNDFFSSEINVKHVDCVIGTLEMEELLQLKNADFMNLQENKLDNLFNVNDELICRCPDYGSSGGYCEYLFRYAAKEILGCNFSNDEELPYKMGKNSDFKELNVTHNNQSLNFAIAYGFRNIQNITRLMKTKNLKYDYIEVMACPSGCLNGGGQIKSEDKAVVSKCSSLYGSLPVRDPMNSPVLKLVYSTWLDSIGSEKAKEYLYTNFHAVDTSMVSIRW